MRHGLAHLLAALRGGQAASRLRILQMRKQKVQKGCHLPKLSEPVGPELRFEPGEALLLGTNPKLSKERGMTRGHGWGTGGVRRWKAGRAGPELGPSTAHPLPQSRWLCRSRGLLPPMWSSWRGKGSRGRDMGTGLRSQPSCWPVWCPTQVPAFCTLGFSSLRWGQLCRPSRRL